MKKMNACKKYRPILPLPEVLRNQIAAGEVVERPASVLKELVENSLDAGATDIAVTLEDGGQTSLAVRDNGHGLPAAELELAVTRHATSKLSSFAELLTMNSYGFRGEALPSIASVSDVLLESAFAGDSAGGRYPEAKAEAAFIRVRHGELVASGPSSLHAGTLITVRDIFANVPARLKFLKTPATELKRCQEIMFRFALACPDIAFSLSAGDDSGRTRELLRLDKALSLPEKIALIWPEQITQGLIPFHGEKHGIRIHGLASLPRFAQARGDRLLLYVNKRPVNDRLLLKALREAYKGRLTSREYPQSVLFLEIDPREVDVNVHPAKSEVRFRDERSVFSALLSVLGGALADHDPLPPRDGADGQRISVQDFTKTPRHEGGDASRTASGSPVSGPHNPVAAAFSADAQGAFSIVDPPPGDRSFTMRPSLTEMRPHGFWGTLDHPRLLDVSRRGGADSPEEDVAAVFLEEDIAASVLSVQEPPGEYGREAFSEKKLPAWEDHSSGYPDANGYPVRVESILCLGQVADTYLILLQNDTLLLLDQHAAHERVLLHAVKQQNDAVQCQLLTIPEDLPLHPAEAARLQRLFSHLFRLGYSLETGMRSVSVNGVPALLGRFQGISLLRDILADRADDMEDIFHLMACKGAVKAGQRLTGDEAAGLISRWLATPDRSFCPHGRPTALSFSPADLEKMFKRKTA
ncbi:MAG: DNA mismatch repair endonuclease MutL [Desulfovibrio sp.]|nr:DNA mismatch repair endonuclease MutL [Desulfovibrio sp.]